MAFITSLILISAFFAELSNAAIGPVANLTIANAVISPDGFSRAAVLAGGTFPGPLIRGNKGDTFRLNVQDRLSDATMVRTTSIHWHGIEQRGSNWADGAAFVTQCPIAAGNDFQYQFTPVGQAGTFWYHSHLSTQYCDGLKGPLVIYDPHDPHSHRYDVDDESTIISLSDWYHLTAKAAMPPNTVPPESISTLINGKGRDPNGPSVPLSTINVQRGKRYRFRFFNMACDPDFTVSIDGHKFTIIEADGVNTAPLIVDSFRIFSGQRYSAVLNANQPVANYWVRAEPNVPRGTTGFVGGINSAILRYAGAPSVEPNTTQTTSILPLNETNLHPLVNPSAPGAPHAGGADVALNIPHVFDFDAFKFKMNNASWISPTLPVLLQILSGARTAQDLLPSGAVYTLPKNKVIEISLPGSGTNIGGPHPFHLHGHTFSVVRSAGSSTYNYVNPVRRDTVSTGLEGDNVTIRFVTDNTGPWFLHCHIDWHLELGLAVVFAENPDEVSQTPRPAAWEDLCPTYNALAPEDQE